MSSEIALAGSRVTTSTAGYGGKPAVRDGRMMLHGARRDAISPPAPFRPCSFPMEAGTANGVYGDDGGEAASCHHYSGSPACRRPSTIRSSPASTLA